MDTQTSIQMQIREIELRQVAAEQRIEELCNRLELEREKNRLQKVKIDSYKDIVEEQIASTCFENELKFSDIPEFVSRARRPMIDLKDDNLRDYYQHYCILFNDRLRGFTYRTAQLDFDLCCLHGAIPSYESAKMIAQARRRRIPIIVLEDAFIECVAPLSVQNVDSKYKRMYGILTEVKGMHYFGGSRSSLEDMLDSEESFTQEEMLRARRLLRSIISDKISKYNHQPVKDLNLGRKNHEKVLVVDQVWGDNSISCGLASDGVFDIMLEQAISENPEADILVKTHPVPLTGMAKGHFARIENSDNIYRIDFPVNPISLLEQVDKVYVCTSTMGFEALMCGKEVHVFGMPFYAGWGVTHDRLICPRRTKKRNVDEIFYAAYVKYPTYVSYKTNRICEIEDAIDEILELREEYWAEQRKKR